MVKGVKFGEAGLAVSLRPLVLECRPGGAVVPRGRRDVLRDVRIYVLACGNLD